jgi:phosphate acetyltransferase
MADLFSVLTEQIKGKNVRIVLPEANDIRIIEAASRLSQEELVKVILVGNPEQVTNFASQSNFDVSKCEILDPLNYAQMDEMIEKFVEVRKGKATKEQATELLKDDTYFGTMLVYLGLADGLVSGAVHSTGDTVRPALQIVKTKPGASKVFGYFVMQRGEERYIFADCAINPNPSSEDLAEFAIMAAKEATLYGIEPRVAMLSFSTNGSANTDETQKVREATRIAKEKAPELMIDGEMQFDAAFVASVGQAKFPGSKVAGNTTVFVFPDLNAGNIGYKIAQRLGGFEAVGPVLAGINAPVNDLSRGCSSEDAYKTVILTAAQSLNK